MSWPTPQDYNEALQHPAVSFKDAELKLGVVATNALGLPRPMTGTFASVYRLHCQHRDWAVRCFLHDIPDQHERYTEISKFILSDDLECTVDFEFLKQGILVGGKWYPILKMQWVDGVTLNQFLEDAALSGNAQAIDSLCDQFEQMVRLMQQCGIAHGDLQHGNVLILPQGGIRLVDYDGMFVPSLQGWISNELGQRNYQHPARNRNHFCPYLDNFAAWVIYLSLRCLAIDPTLWHQTKAGDDCLLFRQADFQHPKQSHTFRMLAHHPSVEIRKGISMFESMLSASPEKLPGIEALGPDAQGRNYRRPSLFDRMLWSLKSLSFRVPDWYQEVTSNHSTVGVPADGFEPEVHNALPGWLDGWIHHGKQEHQRAQAPNLPPHASTATASSFPVPAFTPPLSSTAASNRLPDWLVSGGTTTAPQAAPAPLTNSAPTSSAPPSYSGSAQTATNEALARKLLLRGWDLSLQHQYKGAEDKLHQALNLVPPLNLKLQLEILRRLALIHSKQADEMFIVRKIVGACSEYEKALLYLDTMTNVRGGNVDLLDSMMKADCLHGMLICYEHDGKIAEAISAAERYIAVLNILPSTGQKMKRAKQKLVDLNDALKASP